MLPVDLSLSSPVKTCGITMHHLQSLIRFLNQLQIHNDAVLLDSGWLEKSKRSKNLPSQDLRELNKDQVPANTLIFTLIFYNNSSYLWGSYSILSYGIHVLICV